MNKNKLFDCIKTRNLNYSKELMNFIDLYQKCADELYSNYENYDDENRFLIKELIRWINYNGQNLFSYGIKQLDNDQKDKIEGFIKLYSYLLNKSKEDISKYIDQLFFIPGQFFRDFSNNIQVYICKDFTLCKNPDTSNKMKYTFNMQGTFSKVPCFSRR